ncbi:HAD family hydrolase [Paenibacillus silvisoli]|uniref:HAD family hydrolase n=1 Tax=Paenibacillus silvisoli TaxID=3110539 RepID=UPI002803DA4E|nr:HAD family hydrolase [Paenibacillus silvisoli]
MQSENWLSALKVIIFDMDGTLYQEDSFMDRYIRYMLEATDREHETEAAVALGRAILTGEHPVQFGHFYSMQDDALLVRKGDGFAQGLSWDGGILAGPDAGEPVPDLIHIGDPWCIAAVIGHKYKLSGQKIRQAFERVREEMVQEPYRFEFRSELVEAIAELDAVEKKIVMTNTYLASGMEFLHYMQIHDSFDAIYCDAEKPRGIQRLVTELLQEGYQPHEILSIGDNPWNDLHPVKQLGGRTCFISPYGSADPENWDLRLTTLDELQKLMQDIQAANTRREFTSGEDRAQAYQQEVQG